MAETEGRRGSNNEALDEGYRDYADAVTEALSSDRMPDSRIYSLEFGFLASGEVTVRWHTIGDDDPDGFVLGQPH